VERTGKTLLKYMLVGKNSFKQLLADYNIPAGHIWPVFLLRLAIVPAIFQRVYRNK
jgi:hypothetical protein